MLLLAICSLPLATAQTGFASLSGRVVDSSGAVIPKAEVIITNIDTHTIMKSQTNNDGIYNLPGIQPGRYVMRVEKQGFRSVDVTGLTLYTQDLVARNFTLEVGSASESVTVNGSGVNINTTDASVSTVIDRDFVENMPLNGRSLQDLETLAPGVAYVGNSGNGGNTNPGQAGELTVNGQRTEANNFTVDGISANVGAAPGALGGAGVSGSTPAETALGTTQSMVSIDALQEFRATTSTYSAEYGHTPGGQFSFTTRSGTNDWHGSAYDYFRNEALDANNWFNDSATPQVPREKERQNDFGGTLGGPIRIPRIYNGSDRTFFFFSYEGLRLWTPQGLSTSDVPDQSLRTGAPEPLQPALNAFPLPNEGEDSSNSGFGIYQVGLSFPSSIDTIGVRIDHNINEKFKVFGRYANTPSVSSSIYQAIQTNQAINNRLVTLGTTNLITSKQTNELRFNISQINSNFAHVSTDFGGASPFDIGSLPGPGGGNLPKAGAGGEVTFLLEFGGYPAFDVYENTDSQRQYDATDSYSWTLGHHSLKFGVDWRRLTTQVTPTLAQQFAEFTSQSSVLANNVGPNGLVEAFAQSPTSVEPLYKNFSAFVQDDAKLTPRFSLSLGLRWDVNPAPTNLKGPSPYTLNQITDLNTAQLAPEGTPLWKTDWLAFAPRLGFAYQLHQTAGRQTVLRAGLGMFYDMGSSAGSDGFEGVGFQSSLTYTNVAFPLTTAQFTLPPPSIAPPYQNTVFAFDPSLKLPYALHWNVALEQSLGGRQALTITYVGSGSRRLLESYQILPSANPNFRSGGCCAVITKNGPTSDFNSLQVQFQRTLSHGLQALASYTWSHSIDEASSNFFLSDLLERASSDFDIRHNFQAALTYEISHQYSNALVSGLFNHWAFDTRVTARSALPVDIFGNSFVVNVGTNQLVNFHPNLVSDQPLYVYGAHSLYPGGRIINYNKFNVPSSGAGFDSEGNTPRNYARGFDAVYFNFAMRREFPIHERLHLQFRTEAFNVLNHPVFSGIYNYLAYGPYIPSQLFGFGAAGGTLNNAQGGLNPLYGGGGPRSLQLALKLIF